MHLPHKGHDPAGSPLPLVVIGDMDPLYLQGLDLYATLTCKPVMPSPPHVGPQALKDVFIGAPTWGELDLDLRLTPQCNKVHSLILG